MTSSGIEPAAFQFIAQRLSQLRPACPKPRYISAELQDVIYRKTLNLFAEELVRKHFSFSVSYEKVADGDILCGIFRMRKQVHSFLSVLNSLKYIQMSET